MIIMKKFFSALFVVLLATNVMAQTGLTCDDPIPVDKNYRGTVDGPCTLWYTANTYDLPLHVYFSPNNLNSTVSPEVIVDLTCTPGVYEDSKVDSLLNMVSDFGVEFPVEFMCDLVVRNGKNEWDLAINQSYRDQLAEFGVTYNVQAFIKVVYYEGGTISLTPDTVFSSCIENAHYLQLADSVDIEANDSSRVFMIPYADWQNDSIRFVWTGEKPAQVWLATMDCEFKPDASSGYVWDNYEVNTDTPYKLYSNQMKDAIKKYQSGGLFYGKILSSAPGKLVVEKIPMAPVKGGATLLEYGKSVKIGSNDNTLYCFPRTWSATQFLSSEQVAVSMYVSNQPDFITSSEYANVLGTYAFDWVEGLRALYLSNADLDIITSQLNDNYVYVRFQSSVATTITPSVWKASECVINSISIKPNETFTVVDNSNVIYRFKYNDFAGYGFVLKWVHDFYTLPTYIADTCSFMLTTADSHVLKYSNIIDNGKMTIKPDVYAGWENRVDADGYLYVRFNATDMGEVTFVTDKPAPIISPCVLASTLLEPKAELVLNLDKAFDIYRIDYQAWLASGVKLVWTGASPLHTFVAKDCEFAVAIYHKDVVNYTEVPAEGNVILSKDILATLGQYVDEDGYLYIRFLTELEGALTTQVAE